MNTSYRAQSINFFTGGVASITAEICTLPLDTLKVRLQQDPSGKISTSFKLLWIQNGLKGFYKGIVPGIWRQGIYSSIKMGIYNPLKDVLSKKFFPSKEGNTTIFHRVIAGGMAGSIGSTFSNPFDILKIRMQSGDINRSSKCFPELYKLGIEGLYRGINANIQRAFIVNASELATYDTCKNMIIDVGIMGDHMGTHFCSSIIAGFFAAGVSAPIDFTKTKLMNNSQYKGIIDCVSKTVKNEGVLALYRGFIPSWMRIGPWCTIMFVSWEQYKFMIQKISDL